MAQEILTTFEKEIDEVTLKPHKDKSGVFRVACNQELIWCRERDKGFPDVKELKQKIRDYVTPEKELGHIDQK